MPVGKVMMQDGDLLASWQSCMPRLPEAEGAGEGVGVGGQVFVEVMGGGFVRATSSLSDEAGIAPPRARLPSTLSDPRPSRTGSSLWAASRPAGYLLAHVVGQLPLPCARTTPSRHGHVDGVAATRSREDAIFMILKFGNVRKRTLSQHRRSGARAQEGSSYQSHAPLLAVLVVLRRSSGYILKRARAPLHHQ